MFQYLRMREITSLTNKNASPSHKKHVLATYFSRYRVLRKLDLLLDARTLIEPFRIMYTDEIPVATSYQEAYEIVDICLGGGSVFLLTDQGFCLVMSDQLVGLITMLNFEGELVRSIYYNVADASIVIVYIAARDGFSKLRCSAMKSSGIVAPSYPNRKSLFETENMQWPGFIEFDDVNKKILTFCASSRIFKVWRMVDYSLIFTIPKDERIKELKISRGTLLVIRKQEQLRRYQHSSKIRLDIRNIENGETLAELKHFLKSSNRIEFIEHYETTIILKQKMLDLQIINLTTMKTRRVPKTKQLEPSDFIFLYKKQIFLTVYPGKEIVVRTLKGNILSRYPDRGIWANKKCPSLVHVTSNEAQILSSHLERSSSGFLERCIFVSDILTGAITYKFVIPMPHVDCTDSWCCGHHCTSLYYSEATHELYTAMAMGRLILWKAAFTSNGMEDYPFL